VHAALPAEPVARRVNRQPHRALPARDEGVERAFVVRRQQQLVGDEERGPARLVYDRRQRARRSAV
jgi:hypothetical protein